MSLTGNNILGGASGQTTGYDIEQSLRFEDGDSAKLDRTPSGAGNRKTWTWSCWVKHSTVASDYWENLFGAYTDANNYAYIVFEDDVLRFFDYQSGSAVASTSTSEPKYRDPSAWRHIVVTLDTTQATDTNRLKFYINGEQLTLPASVTYPSQNDDGLINSAVNHRIGGDINGEFDGYLAEMHFIDGTALDASSFGETNEDTNQWQAIKYAGSYGTNGFYLKFQDSSALGDDSSGNTNDFTVTNLVATDQVLDSPTLNYCTLNPLWFSTTYSDHVLSEGNLGYSSTADDKTMSTFVVNSGKWYAEWYQTSGASMAANCLAVSHSDSQFYTGTVSYSRTSTFAANSNAISWPTALVTGDIVGLAFDTDTRQVQFYVNGSLVSAVTQTIAASTEGYTFAVFGLAGASNSCIVNFGQDSSFAGNKTAQGNGGDGEDFYYTPPTGFKALNTDNLPDPSIADPTAHFNTVLYTGNNGSNQSVTGVNFSPDFLWIKPRDYVDNHGLIDSVRGGNYNLWSNSTSAEQDNTGGNDAVTLDSDGFTVNQFSNSWNRNGYLFVSWNWKAGGTASTNEEGSLDSSVSANTTAGFSVLTYTGNETAGATVGHGLSQAPELVINKVRGASSQWYVNATAVSDTSNKVLMLNDTGALDSGTLYFNDTDPTSTLITLGSYSLLNSTGSNLIYCWHSVEGYSKIGKYTGNGSADGTFVYTGFRPAFVMIKRYDSSSGANWILLDSKRDTFNVVEDSIYANLSNAEDATDRLDFVSNGFKLRQNGTTVNTSSGTYIYLAIAESPFKTSNAR